ncbi:MAG: GDP-L-fucose synthase [Bacteroidia bacterium]
MAKIAGIKMVENYARQYGCNFTAAMPTNLYGPNDNYDLQNSHVLPALLRKIHLAKCLEQDDWESIRKDVNHNPIGELTIESSNEQILQTLANLGIKSPSFLTSQNPNTPITVEIWGTGSPLREFLHVDDLAEACYFIMESYDKPNFLNVGSGHEISIKDLAILIKDVVGYKGELMFNTSKPDGTLRKLMDSTLLNDLGWKPTINLTQGIESVYQNFRLDIV